MHERDQINPSEVAKLPADDPNVAADEGGVDHEKFIGEELRGDDADDVAVDAMLAEDEPDTDPARDDDPADDGNDPTPDDGATRPVEGRH